jgi:hypothetical protein
MDLAVKNVCFKYKMNRKTNRRNRNRKTSRRNRKNRTRKNRK